MRPTKIGLIALAASCLTAGCGKDPIRPGPDTGPLTAYVDGVPFVAESAEMIRLSGGIRVEARSTDGRTITLGFPDMGDRNYLIGPGNPTNATVTIGSSIWTADETGGRGTITVTGTFPSRIQGSFSLTLLPESPSGRTLQVTEGQFQVGQ